jgi:hypothetical protein
MFKPLGWGLGLLTAPGLLLTVAAATVFAGVTGQSVECAGGFFGGASKVGGAVVRGATALQPIKYTEQNPTNNTEAATVIKVRGSFDCFSLLFINVTAALVLCLWLAALQVVPECAQGPASSAASSAARPSSS